MKKIIATVLAMVMALALCTVAFADVQKYDFYDAKTGEKTGLDSFQGVALDYVKAKTTSTGANDPKSIAHYTVTVNGQTYSYVETSAADADYILKYAGKSTVAMYVAYSANGATYNYDGKVYDNFGTTCGQFKKDANKYSADTKFYTAVVDDDDNVDLFYANKDGDVTLLVDGALVKVTKVGTASQHLSDVVVQHLWVLDRVNKTAKCTTCGATAKLYEKASEIPAGATYDTVAGGLFLVVDKAASTTTTTTGTSPKTFDAGIAMYVGMALTSVAGSAVVIGKKKEF